MNRHLGLRVWLALLVLGSCIVFAFLAEQAKAAGCDRMQFGQFLVSAQSLLPDTLARGESLLACPRQDYRETAVFWMSFYLSQKARSSEIRALGDKLSFSGSGAEKNQVIQKAWLGDFAGLQNRVRIGQRSYADDPQALLALARNQARFGQFADALAQYQEFIRVQDNNEAAEIERLYVYIWSGDKEAAKLRIAAIRRFAISAYLKESTDRASLLLGETLASPLPETKVLAQESHAIEGTLQPEFQVRAQDFIEYRGYRRQAAALKYEGLFHAQIAKYQWQHIFEDEEQEEASLAFGYHQQLSASYGLGLEVGYFTPGKQNFFGFLSQQLSLGQSVKAEAVLAREPLALHELPLFHEEAGLKRDALSLGLKVGHLWSVKTQWQKDGHEAPFQTWAARLQFGKPFYEEAQSGLGIFIPLFYSEREKPAADTPSYPKEWRVGLGIEALMLRYQRWYLRTAIEGLSLSRSYFQNPDSFAKLRGAIGRLSFRYDISQVIFMQLEGERQFFERNLDDHHDEKISLVTLSFGTLARPHHAKQ